MNNFIISVFGNKTFLEIIKEMELFLKVKAKYYENIDECITKTKLNNQLIVFFQNSSNGNEIKKIKNESLPVILILENSTIKKSDTHLVEYLYKPFEILEFQKKLVLINAKKKFYENSIINLKDYIIDKNERKIKKDGIELRLSEKEINFLILFSKYNSPLNRNLVLKNVWNYSPESETHTLETHIHRLRKKILKKFNDNNFIKNNEKGYYI
jgi:DNA-binding response OmpR family regulator